MNKNIYYINNLSCAHCGEKIIEEINNLPEVEKASFNFTSGALIIYSSENTYNIINEIIKKYEPEAKLSLTRKDKNESENPFYKIIISVILVIIGLLIPFKQSAFFFFCSYLIVGWKTIKATFFAIKSGNFFDEKFLMTVASVGAICIGEYIEATAVMLLYTIGESLQDKAIDKSRREINNLLSEPFDLARFLRNGKFETDSAEKAEIGDIIVVNPGEKITLDGIVINGISDINTSSLTGEAFPETVGIGDNVMSGSINLNGVLHIRVTELFKNSTANKIRDLIENVSEKKGKTENLIARFAKIYTPGVLIIAVLIIFISLGAGLSTFSEAFKKALTLLVISCPCSLVISVPLCYFAGIGKASSEGILIKGGNYIDALAKTKNIVFDKTGTLTTGEFSLADIISFAHMTKDEILYYCAMAESFSNHPISQSIIKAYVEKGNEIDRKKVMNYKELAGQGISAKIDGKEILLGNSKLFSNTDLTNYDHTTVFLSVNGTLQGAITLTDTIKESAIETVSGLKDKNIFMLTGDNRETAERIGNELGIENIYSNLLPHEKVEKLEVIMKKDKKTVFTGDGINDAPALRRADTGIVMGGIGSDAAIEAADVVIMTDELTKIPRVLEISSFTSKIIKECISLSIGIKFIIMILSVLGYSNMYSAIFADVGVCLLAILNSLRILRI